MAGAAAVLIVSFGFAAMEPPRSAGRGGAAEHREAGGQAEPAGETRASERFRLDRIGHVLLRVSDLERSKAFYVDRLGMRYSGSSADFVFLNAGGGTLVLTTEGPAPKVDRSGSDFEVVFAVADTHTALESLRKAGVTFSGPPIQATEKEYLAHFRDPDGHLLTLFGPSATDAGSAGT
jgi:catechol 2,3-dioxygenase-like lactoylglutathione lyase family enzyme